MPGRGLGEGAHSVHFQETRTDIEVLVVKLEVLLEYRKYHSQNDAIP